LPEIFLKPGFPWWFTTAAGQQWMSWSQKALGRQLPSGGSFSGRHPFYKPARFSRRRKGGPGPQGVIGEGAHPGLIFVDNSTIKPAAARRIAEELLEKGVLAWMLR
jgi:hypothetical protein